MYLCLPCLPLCFPQSSLPLHKSDLKLTAFALASRCALTHTPGMSKPKPLDHTPIHQHLHLYTCMCIHTLTHKHARSYKSHESGKFFPLSLFRLHFSLTTHCDCMRHDPWELTTKTSKLVPHTWKLFIFNFFGSLTTFGLCVAREEVYCLATKRLFLPLPSIKF